MGTKERRDEFMAKAKEAEDKAQQGTDEANKAAWLRIAAGYHDLASHTDKQHSK